MISPPVAHIAIETILSETNAEPAINGSSATKSWSRNIRKPELVIKESA
jgi:hypothetical protein